MTEMASGLVDNPGPDVPDVSDAADLVPEVEYELEPVDTEIEDIDGPEFPDTEEQDSDLDELEDTDEV